MRRWLRRRYIRRLLAARYWIPAEYSTSRHNERWNMITGRRARACQRFSFGLRLCARLVLGDL